MTTAGPDVRIDTWRVTVTHPRLGGPLVMDLVATSQHRAINRARLTAFHLYRDAALLDATYDVELLGEGVWPEGTRDAAVADPADDADPPATDCGCGRGDCGAC